MYVAFVINATIATKLVRTIPYIFTCAKRAIITADYLYMNFVDDRTPDDEEFLEGFGFNALGKRADWSKVLKIRFHIHDSYSNEIEFLQELYIYHNLADRTIGIATLRSSATTPTTLSTASPLLSVYLYQL